MIKNIFVYTKRQNEIKKKEHRSSAKPTGKIVMGSPKSVNLKIE